eukprot:Sspe_Gene.79077::Locus_49530_Transcript_1_1_Confidence_1.000_Length_1157::g.79077::m.79077
MHAPGGSSLSLSNLPFLRGGRTPASARRTGSDSGEWSVQTPRPPLSARGPRPVTSGSESSHKSEKSWFEDTARSRWEVDQLRTLLAPFDILLIFRQCLRGFAAHPDVYGPLASFLMREYDRLVLELGKGVAEECELFSGESQRSDLYSGIREAADRSIQRVQEVERLERDLREATQELSASNERVADLQDTVIQLRTRVRERSAKVEEYETEIDGLREQITTLQIKNQELTAALAEMRRVKGDNEEEEIVRQQLEKRAAKAEAAVEEQSQKLAEQVEARVLLEERLEFLQDNMRNKLADWDELNERHQAALDEIASLKQQIGMLRDVSTGKKSPKGQDFAILSTPLDKDLAFQFRKPPRKARKARK